MDDTLLHGSDAVPLEKMLDEEREFCLSRDYKLILKKQKKEILSII